jgi:phosphoglycolate phosphatase-like HAD superfamily hydrolase
MSSSPGSRSFYVADVVAVTDTAFMLLILFDVDGTLFLTDDPLVGEAAAAARGQGAFGCEAEEHAGLIALARQRAGGWPASETVAVGDMPADVAGARAAGIRAAAVASPR